MKYELYHKLDIKKEIFHKSDDR